MTQTEVADLVGVSVRTYRHWEAGETVPYPGEHLRSLLNVFRVSAAELLFGVREDRHGID
jgi:transcriptional regulator with XRE-family HTH domain